MPRGVDTANDPRRQVSRPVREEPSSVHDYVQDAYEPGDPKAAAMEMWADEDGHY